MNCPIFLFVHGRKTNTSRASIHFIVDKKKVPTQKVPAKGHRQVNKKWKTTQFHHLPWFPAAAVGAGGRIGTDMVTRITKTGKKLSTGNFQQHALIGGHTPFAWREIYFFLPFSSFSTRRTSLWRWKNSLDRKGGGHLGWHDGKKKTLGNILWVLFCFVSLLVLHYLHFYRFFCFAFGFTVSQLFSISKAFQPAGHSTSVSYFGEGFSVFGAGGVFFSCFHWPHFCFFLFCFFFVLFRTSLPVAQQCSSWDSFSCCCVEIIRSGL